MFLFYNGLLYILKPTIVQTGTDFRIDRFGIILAWVSTSPLI